MVYSPYLSYYVSSTPFRKFIYPYAQGSTRFNLCKADFEKASIKFEKASIKLPSLENQKRIYSILSHIESKTETEKSLLDLYNSQKQYLLRQMKASIKLPSLENQKRIYSILSHIESKTETEKSLLDLYNSQKQYLLRQMLI